MYNFISVDKKLVNYTDQNKVQIHGSHETGRRRQAIKVPYASHYCLFPIAPLKDINNNCKLIHDVKDK